MLKRLRHIILILAALVFVTSSFGAELAKTPYTFRNTYWGMTKDEIKSTEPKNQIVIEDANTIAYKVDIDGNSGLMIYGFDDDGRLIVGAYVFGKVKYNDPYNAFTFAYRDLLAVLDKKYGNGNLRCNWNGNSSDTIDYQGANDEEILKGSMSLICQYTTKDFKISATVSLDTKNLMKAKDTNHLIIMMIYEAKRYIPRDQWQPIVPFGEKSSLY